MKDFRSHCQLASKASLSSAKVKVRHESCSLGVVKDDAERLTVAGTHPAHAVTQVDAIEAARALYRSMMHREDHAVALAERHNLDARLHAGSLFREYEFATGEVSSRCREQKRDLQREDMLAIEILMQAVVVTLAIL